MTIRKFLPLSVLCVAPLGAGHVQSLQTSQVTLPQAASAPGIHYQLPKNYFSFQFKLQTTKTTKGPFCDVARYFFVLEKMPDCTQPSPKYEVALTDDFNIQELAEPDTDHIYGLTIQKGLAKEAKMTLSFGDGGVLGGYQSTVADHKLDFALGIFKTIADAAKEVLTLSQASRVEKEGLRDSTTPVATESRTRVPDKDCAGELDEGDRERYARLGIARKAITCKIDPSWRPVYLHTPDELKSHVDLYVADGKTAYQHLFEALAIYREYRELLADDAKFLHPEQFPVSSEIFASLLKSRQDRKEEIRRQFTGTQTKSVDPAPEIIWRASAKGGDVQLLAYRPDSDDPVCFNAQPEDSGVWRSRVVGSEDCPANGQFYIIRASLTNETAVATDTATVATNEKEQGLAYCIPGKGTLRVYVKLPSVSSSAPGTTEFDLFRKTYDVAQMGVVSHLPPTLGSSSSYDVALDSLTGALRTITLGSKGPINGDLLQQVGDLNSSVLGAVNAAKQAHKKPTELETAQNQRTLKTEQLRIKLIDACNQDPSQAYCTSILPTLFK